MSLVRAGSRRIAVAAATLALAVVPFTASGVAAEDVTSILPADVVAKVIALHDAEDAASAGFADHEALIAQIEAADEAGLAAIIASMEAWDVSEAELHAALIEVHDLLESGESDIEALYDADEDGTCNDAIEAALLLESVEDIIRHNIIEALSAGELEDAHGHLEDLDDIDADEELSAALEGFEVACGFAAAA